MLVAYSDERSRLGVDFCRSWTLAGAWKPRNLRVTKPPRLFSCKQLTLKEGVF